MAATPSSCSNDDPAGLVGSTELSRTVAELEDATLLRSLAQLLLFALGFLLPFEAKVFSLGSLVITLPELFIYLLGAVWVGTLSYRGLFVPGALARARLSLARVVGDPLARAVIIWMAVTTLSALAATSHRVPALKFALRTLSGVLLYFVTRDLARPSSTARRLVTAIVAGSLLSAASTFLETLKPDWSAWWTLFRNTEFSASGMPRASGSFGFPNIGAMYWEATLPLLLLGSIEPTSSTGRPTKVRQALAYLLVAILVHAVLASATRASIYGVAFVATLLLLIAGGARVYHRRWAGAGVAQFAAAVLVAETLLAAAAIWQQGSASVIAQRLLWWREQDWYRASYIVDSAEPLKMTVGATREIPIRIQNTGLVTWHREGAPRVQLSYHWGSGAAKHRSRDEFEGRRTPLPRDLGPGATTAVAALVEAPARPGRYLLRWDMVVDGATWFSKSGTPTVAQVVEVEPANELSLRPVREAAAEGAGVPLPSRTELWTAALRLWRSNPLLGVGPDIFRHRYGEVVQPAEGGRFTDERMHANNLYLEVLADLGLAGAAALLLLVYGLADLARRALTAPAAVDPLVALPLLALLTFFVHGSVDYFLEFTPTFGLWWLLIALADRSRQGPAP